MTLSRRLLCALLVCVFLFVPFSVSSHATEVVLDNGMIADDAVPSGMASVDEDVLFVISTSTTAVWLESCASAFTVSSNIATLGEVNPGMDGANSGYVPYSYGKYVGAFSAYSSWNSKLNIPKGSNLSFSISNMTYHIKVYNASGTLTVNRALTVDDFAYSHVRVTYSDSSYGYFYDLDCLTKTSGGTLAFNYNIEKVEKDIVQIAFCAWFDLGSITGLRSDTSYSSDYQVICTIGAQNLDYTVSYEESTNSLLDKIIAWLSDIKDSIVNLPALIWEKISEGLKSLFIPSEEDMIAIKDKWDELMKERFGALYEASSIISQIMDSFTYQGEQPDIEMPSVTINLDGTDFTFGGWWVSLVPDKFSFLVDLLKSAISIVATLLFVNTLRNKFNKILGDNT